MTGDKERRIREAFLNAGSDAARAAMAEFAIGVMHEIAETRAEVADIKARTFSPAEYAALQKDIRDGAFWAEFARRALAGFKGLVAVALAVAAFWAAYEVAVKWLTLMKGKP